MSREGQDAEHYEDAEPGRRKLTPTTERFPAVATTGEISEYAHPCRCIPGPRQGPGIHLSRCLRRRAGQPGDVPRWGGISECKLT